MQLPCKPFFGSGSGTVSIVQPVSAIKVKDPKLTPIDEMDWLNDPDPHLFAQNDSRSI